MRLLYRFFSSSAPAPQDVAKADAARKDVLSFHPPEPPVEPTEEQAIAFIRGPLADWNREVGKRLRRAGERYGALVNPDDPNPELVRWAYDVGTMWAGAADEFEEAARRAMPVEYEGHLAQRQYFSLFQDAILPYREQAFGAFGVCLKTAERFSIENEDVSECRRWAARLRPLVEKSKNDQEPE